MPLMQGNRTRRRSDRCGQRVEGECRHPRLIHRSPCRHAITRCPRWTPLGCSVNVATLENAIIVGLEKDERVVVVGSGPAGAAATLLLTRAGINVTLLEAGSAHSARGLTARVAGLTVARVSRSLTPRSEGVIVTGDPDAVLYEDLSPGGLTNHWSCAVPRFSPDDLLDAKRAGEAFEWPINYEELAPWYDWVEPLLYIAGSATDTPQLPASKVSHVRSLEHSWAPVVEAAHLDGQALVLVSYAYGEKTTLTLSAWSSIVRPSRQAGPAVGTPGRGYGAS